MASPTSSQSTEPPSFAEILADPTILVKVGPDAHEYHIHPRLLKYSSGYFSGALSSPVFKEAEGGVVPLSDIDPNHFNGFVSWLYNGNTEEVGSPLDLIHWYVVADRLLVPRMKNEVFDQLYEVHQKDPPLYEGVTFAFDNLPETDPLLKLLVDSHCINWTGPEIDKKYETASSIADLPASFLYRVMVETFRIKQESPPKEFPPQSKYTVESASLSTPPSSLLSSFINAPT
ncbi:hypothetical protein P154DRAFT_488166 [Amniculicola lignicola CBS 123094]|uniref:BTB domain-containing protein n=1 Tax=Amniculicola lignicola CBS 123094 TaxID=1392246 RepID=A0A6A5WP81_9PLEO|nr:hypothetical protein P154DRAFT_488166 [Amniculicola lignicola CBS 123094]